MKLAIFGTSGFAREVRDIAVLIGCEEIIFIGTTPEAPIQGSPVAAEEEIPSLTGEGWVFSIGIGNPQTRKTIRERYPDLLYANLIHPSATFGFGQREELRGKAGNIICAGARMTNGILCGNFCVFNLNCTVGHDCIIEDFVTVSPGANVSGNVLLREGSYLGTNSCVLQGKSAVEKIAVGCYTTVGAGAVVTKSVPDHMVVKGVPAR